MAGLALFISDGRKVSPAEVRMEAGVGMVEVASSLGGALKRH